MKIVLTIVCWKCKRNNVQLWSIRDEKGKKTKDYTCANCVIYGVPSIGNKSIRKENRLTAKELRELSNKKEEND